MLVQDHEPLERRCRAAWSLSAATAAAVVIVVASGLRLGAAPPAADDPAKGAQAVKDAAKPPATRRMPGRRCTTRGRSRTRTPASRSPGPRWSSAARSSGPSENRVLQETRHTTGADGTYSFTIPPDQVADALPLHRAGRGAPRLRHPGRVRLRPEHDPEEREAQRAAVLRDRRAAPGQADHRAGRDARGRAGGRGRGAGVLAHRQGRGPVRVRLLRQGQDGRRRAGSGCRSPRPARRRTGSCPRITPPSCTWSPTGSAATWGRSP